MKKLTSSTISIIFPVYNERESIERVLSECHRVFVSRKIKHRFVICEDGSTDGTSQLLRNLQKKYQLKLSQKPFRRGYGGAVIDGIKAAPTDLILCLDSDGQCDPRDISKFIKKFGKSEVLIGWRVNRQDESQRLLFSKAFGVAHQLLFPHQIHDPSCPFVIFSKRQFLPLLPELMNLREGFWWGFVATCVKYRISLTEIPVNHRQRLSGKTQVYKLGKIPMIALGNLLGLVRLRLS